MSVDDRNNLIESYFNAMDAEDLSIVRPALSNDFTYDSVVGQLHGFEGLREFLEKHRTMSNSTHEITQRVHGENMTFTEGVVTADEQDGSRVIVHFCNAFEFDADDQSITRIAVYLNESLDN